MGGEACTDSHPDPRRLEWTSVSEVWVSVGKTSDPEVVALTGALAGGIPLGLAGFLFAPCWDEGRGAGAECRTTHAAGGFAIGAIVGGVVGIALGRVETERWKRVNRPGPRLSVGLAPRRGGFGAAVALRF
jgi:hypothetical protein